MCTTCQEEHRVLLREIEGRDVGNDTPPVFVLTDQNFPSMMPVGGEAVGTCMKIIQIEHSNLTDLVSVFLEITKGFAIPADTVMLLASASHMAMVGTAEYAADFVRANIRMREMLSGGVRIIHGIPHFLCGTNNTAALRTMAEISRWLALTSGLNNNIAATRSLWDNWIRTKENRTDCIHTIRLPLSQHKLEMGPSPARGSATL